MCFTVGLSKEPEDLAAIRPGETPVPIPNTTVKARTADGTVPETVRESRRPPVQKKEEAQDASGTRMVRRDGQQWVQGRKPFTIDR